MSAKAGLSHHLKAESAKKKQDYLKGIASGMTNDAASKIAGIKPDTVKYWIKSDKAFREELDNARTDRDNVRANLKTADKLAVNFEAFSEEYLEMKVFPHQRNFISLLEKGEPAWVHPSMTYEPATSNRILINIPPEHAKSTTITVNYSTYRIALDPNVRIIVISKTLNKAREFVYSIKQRLSHPRWIKMQQMYGPEGGWKEDSETWRTDTVYLGTETRDSGEKDPTLQALGMGGQIYGARADLIILDDVITGANAHEWEKQINWLQKEVITRLGKNGKLLVVGTRIGSIDLYRELRNPEHWSGNKTPFTYLAMPAVLEFNEDPEKWVTLWARSDRPWDGDEDTTPDVDGLYPKWDGPTLFQRRSEVTPSTWAMVYQQQDVEDDSIFSPLCIQGSVNGMRKVGRLSFGSPGHPKDPGNYRIVMGLDPAMSGATAATIIAVDVDSRKRYILDVCNMTEPTPEKIRNLIQEWAIKYQPNVVVAEKNAFQLYLTKDEGIRDFLSSRGIVFREHFTGNNKWDVDFGVASLAPLFGTTTNEKFVKGSNLIEIPSTEGSEGLKALVTQLITWKPDARKRQPTDTVMSLWFAEIVIREWLERGQNIQSFSNSRWHSRRQINNRYVVDLDEAYAEQQSEMFYA
jgi:hypothetical protein